jgi:hypothetical protein
VTYKIPRFLENRLTNGGEVVSHTLCPPFTTRKILIFISIRSCIIPRVQTCLEGLYLKNRITISRIEHATFRLRYRVYVSIFQDHFQKIYFESIRSLFFGLLSGSEKCRRLEHKNYFRTSQETRYVSATESSRLMLCKI